MWEGVYDSVVVAQWCCQFGRKGVVMLSFCWSILPESRKRMGLHHGVHLFSLRLYRRFYAEEMGI